MMSQLSISSHWFCEIMFPILIKFTLSGLDSVENILQEKRPLCL